MGRIVRCATAAVLALLTGATVAAHDGPHGGPSEATFKVGKKGDINIREDVKFGTFLVKRGKYVFAHRLDGDRHTIVLTGIARKDGSDPVVYEIPMRVVAARQVAKRNALHAKELADHSLVVTAVEVAGESSEHVPEA